MKYITYLKTITKCPFCYKIKNRILLENDGAFLTYSLAPYHKYHLLVIPKRHTESIKDLTWDENVSIMALILIALKALNKIGHNDCSVLLRDGQALKKSVNHVHYNIIPGGEMEDISINAHVRKLLSKSQEKSLIKELKKILN